MGACDFMITANGKSAKDAFRNATESARWENGHGGYTGTIAEKSEFVMIAVPKGENPRLFASKLVAEDDERVSSKWGPAGCVKSGDDTFTFFGWASS